jgi:hypothetical protein
MKENKLPGGTFNETDAQKQINSLLKAQFGMDKLVLNMYNYQVHLNHPAIDSAKADEKAISKAVIKYLQKQEAVAQLFEINEMMETPLPLKLKNMLTNGYYPNRCGDIQIILKPGYIDGGKTGTTHGLWAPYDSHIPMVFFGWGVKHGHTNKETYMTDIAATITALLHVQMPSGCVGNVVEEVLK